ncbi:endonuclease [Vaginella massiliensis]|uniref:endonuclease n=1 Tax=Vaginella massiliensis TaxID=1816680 RepID=UPI00083821B2|nr:endonuclease [Vaginella massiliensis]
MKKFLLLVSLVVGISSFAQQEYYNEIDLTKRGVALKKELTDLLKSTHTRELTYKQIWDALKKTDLDPTNSSRVILIYGYNRESNGKDAYYRDVNQNGGRSTDWNREHTYPKSLGVPNLGEVGAGADAHHLRAADSRTNSTRSNLKFIDGSGNARRISGGWYPGDEWKGDIARMMMYMYVRYETQCLPNNVGFGSTTATPDGMIDLFLKWNAEDPVSEIERQRNEYLGNIENPFAQGNRNPFIDNPYLATLIWGGPAAENLWENLNGVEYIQDLNSIQVYTKHQNILVSSKINKILRLEVYNLNGQAVRIYDNVKQLNTIELPHFEKGIYIINIFGEQFHTSKKVMVQ